MNSAFRISSLLCFQLISFIFTLQIRVIFPIFTLWNESAHQKVKHFFVFVLCTRRIASLVLGVCHHSAAATQKTIHAPLRPCKSAGEERAMGSWQPLRDKDFDGREVLFATPQKQVLAVQQLRLGDNCFRIGNLLVVHIRSAFTDGAPGGGLAL